MKRRPVYYDIIAVILVTFAAYVVPIALLWLSLGGR